MADIAVVIVTVNSRADVERNLGELRAQEGVELELVCVDNGSTDGTVEFLEAQQDVRLIANRENRWLAPAWMQGVRASSAPHVLFLTPDAGLPEPDAVTRMKAALDADPAAALAGPQLFDETGRDLVNGAFSFPSVKWILLSAFGLTRLLRRDRLPPPRVATDETVPVSIVNGACMLARRSTLDAVGGLDERFHLYYEEVDLCRRLRDEGWRVLLVGSVRAVHRRKGTPTASGFRERAFAHSERVYIRKHHGLAGLIAVRAARLVERLRKRALRPAAGR